jgi:hypothetical protein
MLAYSRLFEIRITAILLATDISRFFGAERDVSLVRPTFSFSPLTICFLRGA